MPKSKQWDGVYQRPDTLSGGVLTQTSKASACGLDAVERSPLEAVGVTYLKTTDSETDPTKVRVEVDWFRVLCSRSQV